MSKYLIVVDMQKDFITGQLGTPEVREIVPRVEDKIRQCKSNGYEILPAQDTHYENYSELRYWYSGVLGYVFNEDTEEIEICGLRTDICVISNAIILKAFMPRLKITVDSKCCAGTTPENHINALNIMRGLLINIT